MSPKDGSQCFTGSIVPAAMPRTNTHGNAAEKRARHGDARWMREDRIMIRQSGVSKKPTT
jgi:hypothetical protein